MKTEFWELSHRFYGIDVTFYDMCVILFDLVIVLVASLCFFFSLCRKKQNISGIYYAFPYTNIGEPVGLKAYRVGRNKGNPKRKNSLTPGVMRDDIECATCGIKLSLAGPVFN